MAPDDMHFILSDLRVRCDAFLSDLWVRSELASHIDDDDDDDGRRRRRETETTTCATVARVLKTRRARAWANTREHIARGVIAQSTFVWCCASLNTKTRRSGWGV